MSSHLNVIYFLHRPTWPIGLHDASEKNGENEQMT